MGSEMCIRDSLQGLLSLLAEDVVVHSDGGGKVADLVEVREVGLVPVQPVVAGGRGDLSAPYRARRWRR